MNVKLETILAALSALDQAGTALRRGFMPPEVQVGIGSDCQRAYFTLIQEIGQTEIEINIKREVEP